MGFCLRLLLTQNVVFDARRGVRLWEEDGELTGFAWLEEPDGVVMQVHPRPRLDIVAVAPDGTFGSYRICWFDPGSHTGLFEPLGTRTVYRGKGLDKSIMHEGLRRLRELGAHTAFVAAIHENEAARNLYGSMGFQTVNRERLYGKKL